eukprot:TRINITY_DN4792_c0_g1_i1.p3 TRINITY_DN4792_c0_g1~~TRINITY_DN4792_c0_g1_i1.p3  ORF type:complete len:141 (+),score=16.05 TRINITY_DN4792_c0_g1_i1:215-637(+)
MGGLKPARTLPDISRAQNAVVAAASFGIIGSFFWVPALVYALFRLTRPRETKASDPNPRPQSFLERILRNKARLLLLVLCAALCAMPLRRSKRLRHLALWDSFHAYFAPLVAMKAPLPDGPLLFCFMPHGAFPVGQVRMP